MKYTLYHKGLKVYWCRGPFNVYDCTYGPNRWDMYDGRWKSTCLHMTLEEALHQVNVCIDNGVNPRDLVIEEYINLPLGVKFKRY